MNFIGNDKHAHIHSHADNKTRTNVMNNKTGNRKTK